IGAFCIAGAWFYTGGKNPYGYRGLGEVAVFIFFGLIAVLGTQFTQAGTLSWTGLLLALGVGGMSAAVNLANNIRDIPSDSETGKITLAVRLGDARSRMLFTVLLTLPVVYTILIAIGSWLALVGLVYIPFALKSVRTVNRGARGPQLIPVLGLTGRAMLIWAVVSGLAVALVQLMLGVITGFAIILAVIAVGWLLARTKIIRTDMERLMFNRVAFYAATPALLFDAVSTADPENFLTPVTLVITVATVAVSVVYGAIFFRQ